MSQNLQQSPVHDPHILGKVWSAGDTPHNLHLDVDGWSDKEDQAVEHLDAAIPLADRVRHLLLSLRLRRAYVAYCGLCCAMSGVACISTYTKIKELSRSGQSLSDHSWDSWEVNLEVLIGFAVCTETSVSLWLMGFKAFCKDWLCIVDSMVATLTVLSWMLLGINETKLADDMLETDFPVLLLRFMLQPCRMLSTASALRRVHRMQKHAVDIEFEPLEQVPDRSPSTPQSRILTQEIKMAMLTHLPAWCRFKDWLLTYSTHVHGTSLQTFYRSQLNGVGAHILILSDAEGRVLGGFCTEPWRQSSEGYRASPECFLFANDMELPGGETDGRLVFWHARGHQDVLLWCDDTTISFAGALVIRKEIQLCDSNACPAFGSPSLDPSGDGLRIVAFECWRLADALGDDGSLL
eukprot:TRINITY_DN111648_c0_g1_i1.p1 TRINITY_DN111648_c0_g1~~TRINITY_DN111648_c0_g1_i1.p1  ORF type:complete len:408 (+),score=74.21 TRINITY_DN111648_c0_g1_i1:85-1308(+)